MGFGIITINYRRPQILKLFCASIKRLRADVGINFPVVCVSEPEDAKICDPFGVAHVVHPNNPTSVKWNVATEYMRSAGVSYIVVLGSDDIFSSDCLRTLISEMDKGTDLIGFNSIYLYDTDGMSKGKLMRVTSGALLGVGKTISKSVLDAVDWKPWGESHRNFGMDAILHRTISPHVKSKAIIDGVIVDCKSQYSLNKFRMFQKNRHGVEVDSNIFLNFLSKEEKQILATIDNANIMRQMPPRRRKGRTLI